MLFNSLEYAFFFPLVVIATFLAPGGWRNAILLAASCVFYLAYVPKYLLVLFFLILVDYAAGLAMERATGGARRAVFFLSLAANLGVLGFFKYYGFAAENVAALGAHLGFPSPLPALRFALPIGLSFHTFQSMSYTIEVFAGRSKAERSLLRYSLYVLFFPQLVAGPIERPRHLLPQFSGERSFDAARARSGLELIFWGLFKKMVIADRLSLLVNQAYGHWTTAGGASLLLATYAFAVQIYCDFSGYTDVARGSARVLGFDLVENFDHPYSAGSVPEFWRRWHMSLFGWFRDYVYIPLGGSRVSRPRAALNVMMVFLLSGLWHGAAWTFVAWGALQGAYMVAGAWTAPWREGLARALGLSARPRVRQALRVFTTFQLIALGWVYFRAESLSQAHGIFLRIFTAASPGHVLADLGASAHELALSIALVALLEAIQLANRRGVSLFGWLSARPAPQRWTAYYAAAAVFYALADVAPQQFIYFQF